MADQGVPAEEPGVASSRKSIKLINTVFIIIFGQAFFFLLK